MTFAARKPVLAIAGSFSIDSVLTQDGRHVVGKVGGNALWSSLGALISGIAPRIITVVGDDYPQEVLSALVAAGIDTSAVRRIRRSHPVRVTFAHMADGSRLQPVPEEMIRALPEAPTCRMRGWRRLITGTCRCFPWTVIAASSSALALAGACSNRIARRAPIWRATPLASLP